MNNSLQMLAQLKSQATENKELMGRLPVLKVKNLPELGTAQSTTEALRTASKKGLDAIDVRRIAVKKLIDGAPVAPSDSDLGQSQLERQANSLLNSWNAWQRATVRSTENDLSTLMRDLTQRKKEIEDARVPLNSANPALQEKYQLLRKNLIQQFELCLNGSLGFWISLGLLAGWARESRSTLDLH